MSLLHTFCQETNADYSQFIPTLFRGIIHLMNDSDELVVDMSWNALNAVTKVTSLQPVSSNLKVLLKEVLGSHQNTRFVFNSTKPVSVVELYCTC